MEGTGHKGTVPAQSLRGQFIRALVAALFLCAFFVCGFLAGLHEAPPAPPPKVNEVIRKPEPVENLLRPKVKGRPYTVATSRYSHYALDDKGSLALKNSMPYREERTYRFQRTIDPYRSAVIVMDPWVYRESDFLNSQYRGMLEGRVIPLIRQALDRGHPVIVFTLAPGKDALHIRVHPGIESLVKQGKVTVLYHDRYDDRILARYLHSHGIDTLIYVGLTSNMCLLGRQTGMIFMAYQRFNIYFVPEASAAMEYEDTWGSSSIHKASTKIIAQWVAEIIRYKDLIKAMKS
jgi:nicotinamidase-related amidase